MKWPENPFVALLLTTVVLSGALVVGFLIAHVAMSVVK